MSATSRGRRGAAEFGGEPQGGLEAREGKVGVRPADHRPGQREALGVAVLGGGFDRRTAGIRKSEELRGLVEGLANGVVHGRPEPLVIADALDRQNLGVAARRQQDEIGKGDAAGQARR